MARLPGSGVWTLGTFWGAGCLLVSPLILQLPQKALQPLFSPAPWGCSSPSPLKEYRAAWGGQIARGRL